MVQQLKGAARKLLAASSVSREWPFVSLHASNCNWTDMCEEFWAPVPNLLSFGLHLQARRRLKTSDKSSWAGRTFPGRYLGHAGNTPGGPFSLGDRTRSGPEGSSD